MNENLEVKNSLGIFFFNEVKLVAINDNVMRKTTIFFLIIIVKIIVFNC